MIEVPGQELQFRVAEVTVRQMIFDPRDLVGGEARLMVINQALR